MALPLDDEDLQKLKGFIDFLTANPTILNLPQLEFVKKFIEKFGGKVPDGEFNMPSAGKRPFDDGAAGGVGSEFKATKNEDEQDSAEEAEMLSDSESEMELDMDGVIEGDSAGDQPMGDSSKTPTEEEIDQASELRSQAASAYSEQKFDEAIALYTKAIELNPGNALFHAKRGQAFLKLKKPNACINDCNKALEINCDSAAAYKFRGRAHRLLGNWEEAAKDLRQACKLDFDEETDEWLREVTPNAKKIEQHRLKQQRKKEELAAKIKEQAQRRARERANRQQQSAGAGTGAGFRGAFPEGAESNATGGFNINDILAGMQDPEVAAAMEDILQNPANIDKYKSNPKIANLLNVVKNMAGKGGMPFPGGFPGNFGGVGSDEPNVDASATPPPAPANEPKTQPKKSDFVDDGLD